METIINTTNADASKIVFKTDKPAEAVKTNEPGAGTESSASSTTDDDTKGAGAGEGKSTLENGGGAVVVKPVSGANAGEGGENKEPEFTEEVIIGALNKNIGTNLRGLKDIQSVFEENKKLKVDLENKELSFPTPQAKALYDFAVRFGGQELSVAQNYLQTLSVANNIDKLDPKGLQLEAFLLSKPSLDRKRGELIFNAMYEKQFGEGFENDPVLSFQHEEATQAAKDAIIKARESFPKQAASSKPGEGQVDPKEVEAVTSGIKKALEDFNGLTVSFDDSNEGNLNFDLPADQAESFKNALLNPQGFFDELLQGCTDENGNMDYSMYAAEMYEILNRKRIISEAQKHGFERGKLNQLHELKNTAKPGDIKLNNGAPPPPPKKSFEEAFSDAMTASRKN